MKKLNLIRLADVKEYMPLLDREEITLSRFAEILNNRANEALGIHDLSEVCEHPWASVIGDGEMKPAKCLKCGLYI
jgi:hypothetical protein